ncbi:hypothetical protein [Kitasatospora sp. CB02891]|uniref:hypothetical protein n=1 Tax=Kitasatospora sp. CB02891 TaxID=2020329 RepID=UPI000C27355F|nr:hypothetical protein [Kitasatospora sp. CB02891]PJN24073.1 hypothetical protein CG736_19450 [Kitasatospora sp. CB02891]
MALLNGQIPKGFGRDNSITIPLPPPDGGAIGWGTGYLSVCTGYGDAKVRAAVFNAQLGDYRESFVVAKRLDGRVLIPLQAGDQKVDLERVPLGPADKGTCNAAWQIEITLKA